MARTLGLRRFRSRTMIACAVLCTAGMAVSPSGALAQSTAPLEITTVCSANGVTVEGGFETSRISSCAFDAQGKLEVMLEPEDAGPINCSPWYHFRLRRTDGASVDPVPLRFRYATCEHRYDPKASIDWRDWQPLDRISSHEDLPTFAVPVGREPVYIAAQESLPAATYQDWADGLVAEGKARRSPIGQSVEGRPLHALSIGNPDAERVALILGRQHPPEISGSLALFAFIHTIVADTPAAAAFRDRTRIVAIPLVNPDGVAAGHWRHNSGGTDLNRDWGKFTQPETRAVQAYLDRVLARGSRLELVLDFHSTRQDVLYTLPEEARTRPENFIPMWTAALERRLPDFSFALDPGYSAGSGVAKNYFHERYGVPAVTVEFGDDTDREAVARAGQAAALAMFDVFEELDD